MDQWLVPPSTKSKHQHKITCFLPFPRNVVPRSRSCLETPHFQTESGCPRNASYAQTFLSKAAEAYQDTCRTDTIRKQKSRDGHIDAASCTNTFLKNTPLHTVFQCTAVCAQSNVWKPNLKQQQKIHQYPSVVTSGLHKQVTQTHKAWNSEGKNFISTQKRWWQELYRLQGQEAAVPGPGVPVVAICSGQCQEIDANVTQPVLACVHTYALARHSWSGSVCRP